jgi:uncharacterized protein YbcI
MGARSRVTASRGRSQDDHCGETARMEEGQHSVLADVSREMVRVYNDQFGRGPTKARTHWAGSDVLITVLEDTLTPVERRLITMGEHQRVRDMRMFFQYASRPHFVEPMERLTGRRVRSFLSAIDTETDGVAMETFILDPESG